jgi:hypothetical protein
MNGTHQLLPYVDVVNLLGGNTEAITISTEILIETIKEVGLDVDVEKSKYMLVSGHQNT